MLNKFNSIILLFLAQACVGINIVLSKGLIVHVNPLIMLTVRFSFSSFFMFLLLVFGPRREDKFSLNLSVGDFFVLLAEGLGAGILFNIIMLWGLEFTDANSAGLITSLLPIVVIGINILFFKQKLTNRMILAIIISVSGLVLINLGIIGNSNAKNAIIGNLLIFLALIPDGLYYALSKYRMLPINPILKVLLLNVLNLPFLYLIDFFFVPVSSWSLLTLHDWFIMAIIGFTSCFFFILWQKGIQHIDAAYAALSTAFMPLATVLLAWLILGETLTIIKLVGMLLVIVSIITYSRR